MSSENDGPLDIHTFGEQPCFGCSPSNPAGFQLRFKREGDEIVTEYLPPPHFQGPPGIMHGGLVMALADELAAWTIVGLKERLGFTVSAACRFRAPVRIGTVVEGRGRMIKDGGRVIEVEVVLRQAEASPTRAREATLDAFKGTFTFALLDQSGAERLLGRALPDAWQRFCR